MSTGTGRFFKEHATTISAFSSVDNTFNNITMQWSVMFKSVIYVKLLLKRSDLLHINVNYFEP